MSRDSAPLFYPMNYGHDATSNSRAIPYDRPERRRGKNEPPSFRPDGSKESLAGGAKLVYRRYLVRGHTTAT
jgi:hypothetical protein